jgi:hypothetical protein
MPLSVIPWVGSAVEKGAQIAIERVLEKRVRRETGWFLWLSEINRPRDVADYLRENRGA